MSMFTEDPTVPVAVLLMAAACCFAALRIRQDGKYLIWGLGAIALAGAVLAFEWLWVTDRERIEGVVLDIRGALAASDAQRILSHLTPDAQFVQSNLSLSPEMTRALISANVPAAKFDFVRVRGLQTSAGERTRRGKAEFKVFASGSVQGPLGFGGLTGVGDSSWSLGFEETGPGVWKVNRITPIAIPFNPAIFTRGVESRRADAFPSPGPLSVPRGPMLDAPDGGREPADSRATRKALARERERQQRPGGFGPSR